MWIDRSSNCYTFTSVIYRKSRRRSASFFDISIERGLDVTVTASYKFTLVPDSFVISKRTKDAMCVFRDNFLSCLRCLLKTGFFLRGFIFFPF